MTETFGDLLRAADMRSALQHQIMPTLFERGGSYPAAMMARIEAQRKAMKELHNQLVAGGLLSDVEQTWWDLHCVADDRWDEMQAVFSQEGE